MNNNRNNRRRGRGNRNQSGSGNQLNRIDSRARGNAPQLLDKYKKLAQDAQHNGDRVQTEYYLQFADHYFRVIADNKARQDEARTKRGDGRDPGSDDNEDNDDTDNRRSESRRSKPRGKPRRNDGDTNEFEGESGVEGEWGEPSADNNDASEADADDEPEARKPRRRRAPAKDESPPRRVRKPRAKAVNDEGPAAIDSAVLPPAIGIDSSSGDDGDALEAVN